MSKIVKYGTRALGIGVGFAVAGPLGAAVGNYLGEFTHDLLGDAFGSSKDLGDSYGGLLGNLFAGGIQSLFTRPQDYPDFNHHFRRGLIDSLVLTLRERAPSSYLRSYHHGESFAPAVTARFRAAADHVESAAASAIRSGKASLFDALFPTGSTDELLLQAHESDEAIEHSRRRLFGQWYDQVLAKAIIAAQEQPPFTDDTTFRERAIVVIADQLPAAFATTLKEKDNEPLRIALERLSFQSLRATLRDIQQNLPGTVVDAAAVDEKIAARIDSLSDHMQEALRYLRKISASVTTIEHRQLNQSERQARMETELQSLRGQVADLTGSVKSMAVLLMSMNDLLKSQLVLQPALDIDSAVKRALAAGTLLPGVPQAQATVQFQAIIASADASTDLPPLYKGIAAHLDGRHELAAELASDAIFQEKQAAQPRSWYLIRAALLEADALVAAKQRVEAALALEETADLLDPEAQPLLLAYVLRLCGNLYREAGRPADAVCALQDSLTIYRRHLGMMDDTLATVANELGVAQEDNAQFSEAETNYRFALASWELHDGPHAHSVGVALNNLAMLLHVASRPAEAEPLIRRALAIDEANFGKDHPNVARVLNNFAQMLQDTNRLAEAEPLMRRALGIFEVSFGKDHPKVAVSLNNLALLLQKTNRLGEAELLMRRALAIDEASFGKDHPDVARDLNNLALLFQKTDRPVEAEPLMRRALAIDEASFGSGHPKIAIAINNLAALLQVTDRLAEAEPLMRRALVIDEASFGRDHPNVARDLNNLARLLQDANRLTEAESLMRRGVDIFESSLGKDHPNVATGLSNVAKLLYDTNRLAEAEPLMRRALAIFTARYGPEHPHTQTAQENLDALLGMTTSE